MSTPGPDATPGPPSIDLLLPAVADALAAEWGRGPRDLRVVAAHRRTWSATWELAAEGQGFILKWLPRRAERERELAGVARRLFHGDDFVRTPRVACNPTPETFLVEKLAGMPLQSTCTAPPLFGLREWIDRRCEAFARVGAWLRRFHDADERPGTIRLDGVRAYALNREPALDVLGREGAEAFWRMLEGARATSSVRVHGDFTPHNVLVTANAVAVIDLAGINEMERETRAFDAAAMVVGVEEAWRRRGRNYLRFSRAPVDRMIAAFLSASGVERDSATLPVCYAVRHLTRVYNILRTTGRLPGPRNWHVRRLRLAIERPEAIRAMVAGGAVAGDNFVGEQKKV